MSQQHYFSEHPDSAASVRTIEFELESESFVMTASSGTFSASRLDKGTAILLSESDQFPDSGEVLDIGCGWGPIAIAIARLRPETRVWALDVNLRSLELVKRNAEFYNLENVRPCVAEELPADLKFDGIWSNPPIRVGKAVLHELMQTYIPRLKPGASAMLVVQKQLGAESFQNWLAQTFPAFQVARYSIAKGYRVIRVTAPAVPQ
jgi:16S rRNA (guanine1207-N2)-methyltransferase